LKSKTSSLRLPEKMYEEIDNICNDVGCTRNDWLKDLVIEGLRTEKSPDQELKPKEIVEEPTPEPEIKITEIEGNPISSEVTNVRIVEEPIDNSKKSIVNFVPYDGQYLPFAKRYEI